MGGAMKTNESGTSLIEVMIATMFMTIALLSVAMTMVQGIAAVNISQEQLIAKQKAQEALESVFTARNTQEITFAQIQNTNVTGGIFLTGFQPVRGMGIDGIANTADDSADPIESFTMAGPDDNLGTGDDTTMSLSSYQRKITISSVLTVTSVVDPDIRKIDVVVSYVVRGITKTVTVSSLISRFS